MCGFARFGAVGLIVALSAAQAEAVLMFYADLDGSQVLVPTTSPALGRMEFVLNDAKDALSYDLLVTGLDFGNVLTPGDGDDEIVGIHIHDAPPGAVGPLLFGIIGPEHDADDFGFAYEDAVGGPELDSIRFTGVWDAADIPILAEPLPDHLDALFSNALYVQVHTVREAPGEIRGVIVNPLLSVPEPATGLCLWGAVVVVCGWRRRASGGYSGVN